MQNVSLDIFVSDTSRATTPCLSRLEEKHFSYKTKNNFVSYFKSCRTHYLALSICVAQSQRTSENHGLITELEKISTLILFV